MIARMADDYMNWLRVASTYGGLLELAGGIVADRMTQMPKSD